MSTFALLVLFIIHGYYAFHRLVVSLIPSRPPKPLLARRRRIPAHLAVILVQDAENHDAQEEEAIMEETVEQTVEWCKAVGVQRLSVYDSDGVLSNNSRYSSSRFGTTSLDIPEETSPKSPRAPPTPPPSDDSASRPRTPFVEFPRQSVTTIHIPYLTKEVGSESEKKVHRKRRHSQLFDSKPRQKSLTLHILSRESSKPAIAAAARSLVVTNSSQSAQGTINISIQSVDSLLEGQNGFPAPELTIVHPLHPSTMPLELHGFPPWQIRLSEIYYAPRRPRVVRGQDMTSKGLSEVDFRQALDDYSAAEMRLGT